MTKKVNAVTISVNNPSSYEGLLKESGEELLNKIRSGEIVVPKSESREDFIKFVGLDENGRNEFIKSIKPVSGDEKVKPDESGKKPDEISGDSSIPPETGDTESGKKPDSPKTPEQAHQELLEKVGVLTNEVNKHRGNAGKLGKQVKDLNKSLEEARNTIAELQKSTTPSAKDAPVMPDMPDPDDFVEGYMDPDYKDAQIKHHKAMKKFYEELAEYQKSTKPTWAQELSEQIDKTTKIVDNVKLSSEKNEYDTAWSGLWSEAAKIQKLLGLSTSMDIKVINDNQIIKNNKDAKDSDGNPYYTQDVINSALLFLDKVSDEDYDKFSKVTKIINQLYTVDESGMPNRNFQDKDENVSMQAAIALAGLTGQVKALEMTEPSNADLADRLSKKQATNSNLSTGMPASEVGAHDDRLISELTTTEKQEKLLDMNKKIRSNQSLLKDTQFMESFNKLRADLGVARK